MSFAWQRDKTSPCLLCGAHCIIKISSPSLFSGQITYLGNFSCGATSKEPTCQCRKIREPGLILGGVDPLEEGMVTHSGILAYPLENPMDRGAWWANVHGVSQRVRHN